MVVACFCSFSLNPGDFHNASQTEFLADQLLPNPRLCFSHLDRFNCTSTPLAHHIPATLWAWAFRPPSTSRPRSCSRRCCTCPRRSRRTRWACRCSSSSGSGRRSARGVGGWGVGGAKATLCHFEVLYLLFEYFSPCKKVATSCVKLVCSTRRRKTNKEDRLCWSRDAHPPIQAQV